MKRRLMLVLSIFVYGSACSAPTESGVQNPTPCPGTSSGLLSYAGTYLTDQLLEEPEVTTALRHLLGTELDHLKQNISVTGPVDLVSCTLVVSGNADHSGGLEDGILTIDLWDGSVAAAIHTADRIDVYTHATDYFAVPISVRDWLAVISTDLLYRIELPMNARIVPPQGVEP
jgi:hypothetical protein